MDEIVSRLRGDDGEPTPESIRKVAALLGPGFRGERLALEPDRRAEAVKAVVEAWNAAGLGDLPDYLVDGATEWQERRAKLFEIGEYNDRGLSVSQSHLQRLASSFDSPAPVLVEHIETPFRLGYLTDVEAAGAELFGTLSLTPEASALIENSGAKSLSLSVDRDLTRIYEVSVVAQPRVGSARLFCSDFQTNEAESKWKSEALRLGEEREAVRLAGIVESLIREGRITSSLSGPANELLASAASRGLERDVVRFFRTLPKQAHFGEIVPMALQYREAPVEEVEFYRAHFPDVPIDEILKRKVKP
jgi:hypothetical protein